MLRTYFYFITFMALFQSSFTERRIKNGVVVTTDKKYMVYLLRAHSASNQYHGWVCGGAILGEDYVVTSAACVEDVKHLYVVAGYKRYVSSNETDGDECVKKTMKKVIQTCVPKGYSLDYNKTEVWSKIDIALVKVESPFDFENETHWESCSYAPQKIEYNTDRDFPKPYDDVFVMGWGHMKEYRHESDQKDLNQRDLRYASTQVLNETACIEKYSNNSELVDIIQKSMICTFGEGKLSEEGKLLVARDYTENCITEEAALRGGIGRMCGKGEMPAEYEDMEYPGYGPGPDGELAVGDKTRRLVENNKNQNDDNTKENSKIATQYSNSAGQHDNRTRKYTNITRNNDNARKRSHNFNKSRYRRVYSSEESHDKTHDPNDNSGICQNDHGGPLITWRGGNELLVGVATLFKVDTRLHCVGPYLFTKTSCNTEFLHCIMNAKNSREEDDTLRRCKNPKEIGFEIIRRHISWVGHHDGPAANEDIQIRPQVPMSAFQSGRVHSRLLQKKQKYN